jgi:transcriptional regulator with XRE-family HTH domain
MMPTTRPASAKPVGELIRQWRQHRRLSQLDLAGEADISTRHLSYVETGRALPSRAMLLHLAERLAIPLRERNALLTAAGYAPMYAEHSLADPALAAARKAVDLVLSGHEPYPAIAVDRHWTLVAANAAVPPLLAGVRAELLQPPVNVLRLSLHPQGLAPRIANLAQWRAHLIARLHAQIAVTNDGRLSELMRELCEYPVPAASDHDVGRDADHAGIVVPLQLRTDAGLLSFLSTTTVFGTPVDITLQELALESFFPADAQTARILHGPGLLAAALEEPRHEPGRPESQAGR